MKDPGDIEVPQWITNDFCDKEKPAGSFFVTEIAIKTGKSERRVREICRLNYEQGIYDRFKVLIDGSYKYAYRPKVETSKTTELASK